MLGIGLTAFALQSCSRATAKAAPPMPPPAIHIRLPTVQASEHFRDRQEKKPLCAAFSESHVRELQKIHFDSGQELGQAHA